MKKRLKYLTTDVVFQEVPNEISLAIDITNCPYFCRGCHSPILGQDVGELLLDDIDKLIEPYRKEITCVCFMGGDQNINELIELCKIVKENYKLKTCVYSGNDNISHFKDCIKYLDYLKIGRYVEELGGLNSIETNQKFYKINNEKLINITNTFQRKKY